MSAGFCGGAKEGKIFLEPGIDRQYNKNQKNCERREKMTYSQGVSVTAILTLAVGVGVFWYAAKKRSYVPVFLYLCVCVASLPEQLGYLNIGARHHLSSEPDSGNPGIAFPGNVSGAVKRFYI